MKAICLKSTILGAAMAVLPLGAGATVIDFDLDGFGVAIPANTAITNQYSNLGVTFAGIEDGSPVGIHAAPDPDGEIAPSGTNVMTNCSDASSACPGNRADILRISFLEPVSDLSLSLSTLGSSPVTFNLYDASSNLLQTLSTDSGGSTYVPVSFAASGVSMIEGLQPNDGWAWAFDDLSFTVSEVPLPAPLALLGAGLMGLVALRRRKTA